MEKVLTKYLRPELLITDDIGDEAASEALGRVPLRFLRRHERRSMLTTLNRPLTASGKLPGDVPSATALLDHFLHRASLIEITGRS